MNIKPGIKESNPSYGIFPILSGNDNKRWKPIYAFFLQICLLYRNSDKYIELNYLLDHNSVPWIGIEKGSNEVLWILPSTITDTSHAPTLNYTEMRG